MKEKMNLLKSVSNQKKNPPDDLAQNVSKKCVRQMPHVCVHTHSILTHVCAADH